MNGFYSLCVHFHIVQLNIAGPAQEVKKCLTVSVSILLLSLLQSLLMDSQPCKALWQELQSILKHNFPIYFLRPGYCSILHYQL